MRTLFRVIGALLVYVEARLGRASLRSVALKDQFPSIDAGFSFVVPSYTWMLTRIEAADGRLNQVLTLASTVTTALPALAKALRPDIAFTSGYFLLGILLFVSGATIALVARVKSGIVLPHPSAIYAQLDDPEDRFKANAIYFAGQHLAHNVALAQSKLKGAVIAMACLILEIVALLIWLAR